MGIFNTATQAAKGLSLAATQNPVDVTPPTQPRAYNPEVLAKLQAITELPGYAEQVSPVIQEALKQKLLDVNPDGNVYEYNQGWTGIGDHPGETLYQKFVPFQDASKFAPGQQSIYGDVFNRPRAAMQNTLNVPSEEGGSLSKFFTTPLLGTPEKRQAAVEGFKDPNTVPTFAEKLPSQYWKDPAREKPSPGVDLPFNMRLDKNALGGMGQSVSGIGTDFATNPADVASLAVPLPKGVDRLMTTPFGKGFARTVLKGPVDEAAVKTAQTAIRGARPKSTPKIPDGPAIPKTTGVKVGPDIPTELPKLKPAPKVKNVIQKSASKKKKKPVFKAYTAEELADINKAKGAVPKTTDVKVGPDIPTAVVDEPVNIIQKAASKKKITSETAPKSIALEEQLQKEIGEIQAKNTITESAAKPKSVKYKPRSKNINKTAIDKKSENWGNIVEVKGDKVVMSGGTYGKTRVELPRSQIQITKKVPEKVSIAKPKKVVTKKSPLAKPQTDSQVASLKADQAEILTRVKELQTKKSADGLTKLESKELKSSLAEYSKKGREILKKTPDDTTSKKFSIKDPVKKKVKKSKFEQELDDVLSDDFLETESKAKPTLSLVDDIIGGKKGSHAKKSAADVKRAKAAAKELGNRTRATVEAFRRDLPKIINEAGKKGVTVMEYIGSLVDESGKAVASKETKKQIVDMLRVESKKYNSIAKADLLDSHGNWNLKKFPKALREKVVSLAEKNPGLTAKGAEITDAEIIKRAAAMDELPLVVRALLRDKPGALATATRKSVDDFASSLNAVLEDDLGPEGLHKMIQEVIKSKGKVAQRLLSEEGLALRQGGLTADQTKKIGKLMKDIQRKYESDPLISKANYDFMKKELDFIKQEFLNADDISDFMDKGYYVWLSALLSSPKTQAVNFISNAAFMLEKFPNRFMDILGDYTLRGIYRAKGVRLPQEHGFRELPAMYKGFKRALYKKAAGRKGISVPSGSKMDVGMPVPISETLDTVVGAPMRALKAGDDIFKEMVGSMEFYARHSMGDRGNKLIKAVHDEQLLRTFQDDASAFGKWILQGKSNARTKGMRWIIPFVKTPDRILFRSLERTLPGSVIKLGKGMIRAEGVSQKEMAHNVGLVYQATALTFGVKWLYDQGKIVGDAPKDADKRAQFYASGRKPDSIQIGDYWIPFSRVEPGGGGMSATVNFIQDMERVKEEGKGTVDQIGAALGGIAQSLSNKTYLSGGIGLMKAATDPEVHGNKFINRLATSSVPGAAKFFADLIDPTFRDDDGELTEAFKKRIPGLSKQVEPILGPLGKEQKRTIFNIGKVNRSLLSQALDETPIPLPGDKVAGIKITTKERNEIIRGSGPLIEKTLTKLVSHPNWSGLPRGIRATIVNGTTVKIRSAWQAKLKIKKITEDVVKFYKEKYLD